MKHLISLAVMIAVGVAVMGYVRGWYSLSSTPAPGGKTHVEMVVDNNKVNNDKKAFLTKAGPIVKSLEKKLNDLIARSQTADPATKPALDQQIQDLTQQHNDAKQEFDNITNATPNQWDATKAQQVSQKLNDLHSGFDQALSKYK